MKVLVTGATGLIGRHLLEALAGDHQLQLVALTRGEPPEGSEAVEWVRQDLTEPLDPAVLPESIDMVVHLAQSERYRDFPAGADDLFAVNVHSTNRLLEYARGAGAATFVLASTGGVYGSSPTPVAEDDPLTLTQPYFRSKRIAELLLDNYAEYFAPVALRFFFVYGPGPESNQGLVNRLTERILAGEQIVIDGDPGMRINPLYVSDAAAAIAAACGLDCQATINVAGEEVVSITDLVEGLCEALGREARISHSGTAPGDLVADLTRMRELLGLEPGVALRPGLQRVAGAMTDVS